MKRLARFLALKNREKLFLIWCLLVVTAIRAGLSIVGFNKLKDRMPKRPATSPDAFLASRIAWGVNSAARRVPGATCLTQALAGQYLLARAGQPGVIRIGVAHKDGKIAAHAWLLHDDKVILGGTDEELGAYTPLTDLPHTA